MEPLRTRWRTPLGVSWPVAVGALLLATLLGAGSGLLWRQLDPGADTPIRVAQRYFAALERGDAAAARAETAPPPGDTTLLSDAALGRAHAAQAPVRVDLRAQPDGTVAARWSERGHEHNDTLRFVRSDSATVIANAYTVVQASSVARPGAPLSIAGMRVTQPSVALFPGVYPVGAGHPRLTYGDGVLAVGAGEEPVGAARLPLTTSEQGRRDMEQAVRDSWAACLKVASLAPPRCPQRYTPTADELIDAASIAWSSPGADVLAVPAPTVGADPSSATSTVVLTVTLRARSKDQPIERRWETRAEAVVDLTRDQLQVTWRPL